MAEQPDGPWQAAFERGMADHDEVHAKSPDAIAVPAELVDVSDVPRFHAGGVVASNCTIRIDRRLLTHPIRESLGAELGGFSQALRWRESKG